MDPSPLQLQDKTRKDNYLLTPTPTRTNHNCGTMLDMLLFNRSITYYFFMFLNVFFALVN